MGWGCLPHCPPQSYDTKTQNPGFRTLPPPVPPPCKHGFAKRCPELRGTPTMAGMGSGTPKEICVPLPCPPYPSQNLTPSQQDLVLQPRGVGLPPVSFPNPLPLPSLDMVSMHLWHLPPWGTQTSGPLLLALSEIQASDTPIPAQTSEVLVVGGCPPSQTLANVFAAGSGVDLCPGPGLGWRRGQIKNSSFLLCPSLPLRKASLASPCSSKPLASWVR